MGVSKAVFSNYGFNELEIVTDDHNALNASERKRIFRIKGKLIRSGMNPENDKETIAFTATNEEDFQRGESKIRSKRIQEPGDWKLNHSKTNVMFN